MISLKFGVIGTGRFGKHYLRLLQKISGAELEAAASPGIAGRKLVLPRSVKKFSDPSLLIKDPDIDCVVIASPASSHFKLAASALEAGKHVLLEKPMTRTLVEAKRLKKIVEQSDRVFMVGHQYLYNNFIRRLKKELDRKILGRISHVFAEHLYFGPIRSDIGCFWDAAGHELAILQYLFGPTAIKRAKGSVVRIGRGGKGDDFAVAEVILENGLFVTIAVSRLYPEKTRRFSIIGDKGTVVFDDCRGEKLKFFLHPYPKSRYGTPPRFIDVFNAKVLTPKITASEPLRSELEHFIDCVKNKKTPLTDIRHGVYITEMLHKIYSRLDKL